MATVKGYRNLCSHYTRGCSFVSPCCGKVYPCRLCHDEQELTHTIDRFNVSEIECRNCSKRQPVCGSCSECGITFGRYYCPICRLYADEDKQQFHCDKCGLCRVGGRENFFHCDTCGYCLSLSLRESHFCRRQASKDNCPVCMEDLHTSRSAMHTTKCGHLLHALYQCPQCQRSITDMTGVWRHHDREREAWQMPRHLQNFRVKVKCRDCLEETDTQFHVVGFKCGGCGSYNTVRCGNEEIPEDEEGGDGAEMGAGQMLENVMRMLQDWRHRFREMGGGGEEGEGGGGEEGEGEGGEGGGGEGGEGEHEATDEESANESGDGGEGGGVTGLRHDSQTGYEADGSDTEEEPSAAATPTTGPHAVPEPDQATGRWYGDSATSSSEEEWPMALPTAISDWSNSSTQSDSHTSGSDSSWETEEEEVIVGGAPDDILPDDNKPAEESRLHDVSMETETLPDSTVVPIDQQ